MKTKTIQIYDFNELSESAKETALNEVRQRNYGDCWWEFIMDDAKDAGDMTDQEISTCIKNAVSDIEYRTWNS